VIDGFDTLDAIEKTPVQDQKKFRPTIELRIRSVSIHANPLAEQQA
jgi:peptidyl-prolyl cis-trans isomerase-like 3